MYLVLNDDIDFMIIVLCFRLTGIVGDQWDENEALAALEQDREPMKDPHFSWHFQFLVYMFSFYGIVDFLAIVPNYFFTSGDATSYFRVFRLLRTFKVSSLSKQLFQAAC